MIPSVSIDLTNKDSPVSEKSSNTQSHCISPKVKKVSQELKSKIQLFPKFESSDQKVTQSTALSSKIEEIKDISMIIPTSNSVRSPQGSPSGGKVSKAKSETFVAFLNQSLILKFPINCLYSPGYKFFYFVKLKRIRLI